MTCSGYYDEVSVNGNKLVIKGLTSDLKCTIKYTPDNFKVTVNATNATVEGNGSGGKGGYASEIILLTKNTSLTINVGGQNGYNGGGSGYYNGGGASTIKKVQLLF